MIGKIKNRIKQILRLDQTKNTDQTKNQNFISATALIENSEIGKMTSIGHYTDVHNCTIGKYCAISYFCVLGSTKHPMERLTVSAFPYVASLGFVDETNKFREPLVIGNDVWIGCHAIIKPNLKIGDGAVIGANSVVTKDVPDYAVVAGSPAKILKYRFSENIIKKLQVLCWWDLPDSFIKEHICFFQKPLEEIDLDKFIELKNNFLKDHNL